MIGNLSATKHNTARHFDLTVVVPALNEESTIALTLEDYAYAFPFADFVVIDNGSTDETQTRARQTMTKCGVAGEVMFVKQRGKSTAVKRAFRRIDSDYILLTDADCTYPAGDASTLLEPVVSGEIDLGIGERISSGIYSAQNKRPLHNFGNALVKRLINSLFSGELKDPLSGLRIMSRKFFKTFPLVSRGFALETEMSIFAIQYNMDLIEPDFRQ